jgi:hypothetical protein
MLKLSWPPSVGPSRRRRRRQQVCVRSVVLVLFTLSPSTCARVGRRGANRAGRQGPPTACARLLSIYILRKGMSSHNKRCELASGRHSRRWTFSVAPSFGATGAFDRRASQKSRAPGHCQSAIDEPDGTQRQPAAASRAVRQTEQRRTGTVAAGVRAAADSGRCYQSGYR